MIPPIFAAVNVPAVKALLKTGNGPLRFWAFGMAPVTPERPYAVWQTVSGSPSNYLGNRPDRDYIRVQVDCYANTMNEARSIADTIILAIETHCNVLGFNPDMQESQTDLYRVSFDCGWWVER